MANQLDELTGPVNENGQDVNVINNQLGVTIGTGSLIFQIIMWIFIIPGIILWIKKVSARNYFSKLEQRIQGAASEIDNNLEQRVQILQNVIGLLEKAIDLDKDTMKSIAAFRSGNNNQTTSDQERNEISSAMDKVDKKVNLAFENYPELKAHDLISKAMKDNDYTQREISSARSNYNDLVSRWNQDIFVWPAKKIVAAKQGYTTRIPYTASSEVKEQARSKFF